jgi:hypothetical protein
MAYAPCLAVEKKTARRPRSVTKGLRNFGIMTGKGSLRQSKIVTDPDGFPAASTWRSWVAQTRAPGISGCSPKLSILPISFHMNISKARMKYKLRV